MGTEQIDKVVETWQSARVQSSGASMGFHEKLAVLTAGSLALAVSGAGALYQKPVTNLFAMQWLLWSLVASTIFLWLSLVASVVHNALETLAISYDVKAIAVDSQAQILEALVDIVQTQRRDFAAIDASIVTRIKAMTGRMRTDETQDPVRWAWCFFLRDSA
jgi:hypothetical protein